MSIKSANQIVFWKISELRLCEPWKFKRNIIFLGHVACTISHALSVGYIHLSCCSGFQKQHYKSSCGWLAIIYRLLNSIILSKWSISCSKHIGIHLLLINSIFLHKLNTFISIPEALPPVSYWWLLATWEGLTYLHWRASLHYCLAWWHVQY